MLSLVEEILLLALDDESGAFRPLPEYALELATSGASLMDLALRDRVDADPEQLIITSAEPTGDVVLDPVLAELARSTEQFSLRQWLLQLARVRFIRERALERLVERGILRRDDKKFLWVFGSRRYPLIDNKELREVKQRILEILLGDEVPDPRDVILICLSHACSILPSILEKPDLERASQRIEEIACMDLIGQQMLEELRDIRACMNVLGWWEVSEATELEARIRAGAS